MTPDKSKAHKGQERLKQLLANDEEFLKTTVREALEGVLEAEMEELLGAGKSERTSDRAGYRWGYYTRGLITRIGRSSCACRKTARFRTEVFERY